MHARIASTCTFSPYFAQYLEQDPILNRWCETAAESGNCHLELDFVETLIAIEGEAEFKKALRLQRHRTSCQLIFADINGLMETAEILRITSELANKIIDSALGWAHRELSHRFGVPRSAEGVEQRLTVFGLGKLGGQELNFSSDVDLVFAYDADGETDGEKRQLANSAYFTRLAQRLIHLAGDANEFGQPYRIDMRLRPNGSSGPIVLSYAAMEHYFMTHGREWERYAWIKGNPVAGNIESGKHFLNTIRPFIYRKYLDYRAFDELSQMKARIDAEARSKGVHNSVKVGIGGIRSIEFIAQSYQLARGGREPYLQTPSLYTALAHIREQRLMPEAQNQQLLEAYNFLRRLENHLQMVADKQTHTLPESAEALEHQARFLGYATTAAFEAALAQYRASVYAIFEETFERDKSENTINPLTLLATDHLSERESRLESLGSLGFSDNEHNLAQIDGLVSGKLSQSLSAEGLNSLIRALRNTLESLSNSLIDDKDEVLDRIICLYRSIGRRPTYFNLIGENDGVRAQLIDIAAISAQLVDGLMEYPILLDELISDAAEFANFDHRSWQQQLHANLMAADGDIEVQMEILRHQQHAQIFRIAVAEHRGHLSRAITADYLVQIAEVIIIEALGIASTAAKLPNSCVITPIAYGKLGSLELSYNSDLDLVYVYQDHGDHTDSLILARTVRKLTTLVTTRTTGGLLYSIDDRLRPNGKSGQLVTSIEGFEHYLREHAWTWELQALVRARPIGNDDQLNDAIERLRHEVLQQQRDIAPLRKDVREMNARMKEHNDKSDNCGLDLKLVDGGLVDIEFIAQFLVLAHAHRYNDLTQPRSTTAILNRCQQHDLLTPAQATTLLSVLEDILATSQYKKLAGQSSKIQANQWRDKLESVRRVWAQILQA